MVKLATIDIAELLQNCVSNNNNNRLSGTTRVGRYQKKHSPAHTHPGNVLPLSTFSICNGPRHPLYSASLFKFTQTHMQTSVMVIFHVKLCQLVNFIPLVVSKLSTVFASCDRSKLFISSLRSSCLPSWLILSASIIVQHLIQLVSSLHSIHPNRQSLLLHREADKRNQFSFVCIFFCSTETGEFFHIH